MRQLAALLGIVLFALSLALGACGGDEVAAPKKKKGGKSPAATATAVASAAPDAGAPDAAYVPEFAETDFVENDESRDPFRSFAQLFMRQAKERTEVQRKVAASQNALDELTLTGIVSRGEKRALVTDPGGLGWVLRTGDYVGKAELVTTGGPAGVDVALNWRVDRIRESDVVFLREDPAHPEVAPATRVMYLHPVTDEGLTLSTGRM